MSDTERPYFSVVIPLYNRENLIQNTIQSVLDQDTEKTFEVIVVDDGSKDESAKKVAEMQDPRIRYIYQENAGANVARNHGVEVALGKYVAFLDSDDVFMNDHLSTSAAVLLNDPDTVVYAKIVVDRGEGNTFLKPPRGIKEDEHMSDYLFRHKGFLQTSTLVLPTELARKVRFDDELPFGQDMDFAVRLAAAGASFFMKEKPSVIWRDVFDVNRISSKSRPDIREKWVESVKPLLTKKAYLAYRGWFVAKAYAQQGRYGKAFVRYVPALLSNSYGIKHALIVGFQVFFPQKLYRKLADKYISKKSK
ncbi:glycosyltransferase family 2 protein [Sphingobacterium corticibacterium]|uniref:Glycosyltransferase family 2 protein n=1 Tax=Sphingobacterium corticibacterium TaxID=2484746 RepID=A0A4Q6XGE4_9SPHI|nr:glycosyltransferase family 2 protein [Sphingobacterium corticibacterium]RZF58941.1 glycosyltransferase family 2 protein [Sphingobacterium corticibacterium]